MRSKYRTILSDADDYSDSPPRRVLAVGVVDDRAYLTLGGYAETADGSHVFQSEGKGEFCVDVEELIKALDYELVEEES